MPQNILEWGIALILTLQGWGDWLIGPMNLFTFTGSAEFFLLIMPAIYWCWDSRLGLRLAIILLISLILNLPLKIALHDPRPYWLNPNVRLWTLPEITFGIPSAHSQNSVIIWSTLAVYLQKRQLWAVAGVIIFVTGLSRSYLGVHFPTDVLAGWLLGIVTLIIFFTVEATVGSWFGKMREFSQIGLIFAVSLVSIATGVAIIGFVSANFQIPGEWIKNAALQAPDAPIKPLSIEDMITVTGTFFGLIGGAVWLRARYHFDATGPWPRRVARYIIGAIVVFILWRGLGSLFDLIAVDESLLSHILRYIRFAIVGFWISALGPLAFLRLKLAKEFNQNPA